MVDHEAHLGEPFAKFHVGGRREDRVVPEDQEQLDLPRFHCRRELRERRVLAHRLWLDGSTVGHRRADVAERLIDSVRERVDGGRLELARHDN